MVFYESHLLNEIFFYLYIHVLVLAPFKLTNLLYEIVTNSYQFTTEMRSLDMVCQNKHSVLMS